ncbi:hypothetical protein BJX70DRAFT_357469 [Aspergillus crustosus]
MPSIDTLLSMCLGWPAGMLLVLKSPLPRLADAVVHCFSQACEIRDADCALLSLQFLDLVNGKQFFHAYRFGDERVLTAVVSRIAAGYHELQNLALRLVSGGGLSVLLDTKAHVGRHLPEDQASIYSMINDSLPAVHLYSPSPTP